MTNTDMVIRNSVVRNRAGGARAADGFLAVVLVTLLSMLAFMQSALAQNPNVRPPAGAVENVVPGASENSNVRRPGGGPSLDVVDPTKSMGGIFDTEMWKKIRDGKSGLVTIHDPLAAQLIQSEGETWRNLRNGPLSTYGAWTLLGIVGIITLYFLVRGRIRIHGGRSGRVIPRFSLTERVVHWFTAGLWLILAVTGLIILFGRYVLPPLIGPEAFAAIASASLQGHNLLGPVFMFATVLLFFVFLRGNFFQLVDIKWLLKGGGFLGGHASSYRYNLGEKTWFWWATIAGIALGVSGVVMLFPDLVKGDRMALQIANIVHGVVAIGFIAFGIGHIYIATIGMEGALEGMTRGTVDENWAKEHHDLWYEQHKNEATPDRTMAEAKAALGRV